MNKYEVILFDLDDTLIDNLENVRHAYTKMVESVGEHYTEKGFKKSAFFLFPLPAPIIIKFSSNVPQAGRDTLALPAPGKFYSKRRGSLWNTVNLAVPECWSARSAC